MWGEITTVLVGLFVASACSVSGDYAGTSFQCGDDEPCPAGFSCVSGRCVGAAADAAMLDAFGPDATGGSDAAGTDAGSCLRLSDNFDDNTIHESWLMFADAQTSVVETGGQLVVSVADDRPGMRVVGVQTVASIDFRSTNMVVEVPSMLALVDDAQAHFIIRVDGQNYVSIQQEAGQLSFGKGVGGQESGLGSVSYSAGTHRWWRIRERDGTMHIETSPDNVTYTTHATDTTPSFFSAAQLELSGGTQGRVVSPGAVAFDNVSVACP